LAARNADAEKEDPEQHGGGPNAGECEEVDESVIQAEENQRRAG
jgi:hypothetical protein